MYTYSPVDFASLPDYLSLIPENLQKETSKAKPENILTFVAFHEKTPVGICIVNNSSALYLAEFLHLEVLKEHQNKHVGRTLLAKTQELATKRGAKIFTLNYALEQKETPALEKILQANHWKGSRPFLIKGFFDPKTFNAPMVHLNFDYPKGYKEFLWKDLKKSHRENLEDREKFRHFPITFSPFREKEIQEPLNSLGLLYKNRVVGWLITHRVDPDTIRYSCLYIEPSLKFRGLAMKLLADSMLLHMKTPTPSAIIEIPYLQVNASWIHFIERRILPSATKIIRFQQAWHTY